MPEISFGLYILNIVLSYNIPIEAGQGEEAEVKKTKDFSSDSSIYNSSSSSGEDSDSPDQKISKKSDEQDEHFGFGFSHFQIG